MYIQTEQGTRVQALAEQQEAYNEEKAALSAVIQGFVERTALVIQEEKELKQVRDKEARVAAASQERYDQLMGDYDMYVDGEA